MKKALAVLVSVIIALTSFSAAFARSVSDEKDAVGMSIAGFSTQDLYGNTVTSDILNDAAVTVINEWATWCGPCVSEMPHFKKMHEYYSATPQADAQIIGCVYVSGSCTPQSALEFLESNGFTWTNLLEDDILENAFYTTDSIPSTMIVDRHGVVRDHRIGSFSTEAQLKNWIDGWIEIITDEEGDTIPGDMDLDGELSVTDAVIILRMAMQLIDGDETVADYDGNGVVEVSDALMVLRAAIGAVPDTPTVDLRPASARRY